MGEGANASPLQATVRNLWKNTAFHQKIYPLKIADAFDWPALKKWVAMGRRFTYYSYLFLLFQLSFPLFSVAFLPFSSLSPLFSRPSAHP